MVRCSLMHLTVMCCAILLLTNASPPKSYNRKCTKDEPRLLYPYCMIHLAKKTLWCDQSNYTRMPTMNRIHAEEMEIKATTTLFINDSCIRSFQKGDLAQFPALEVMDASQNQIFKLFSQGFVGNKMMQTLILTDNFISAIDSDAFKGLGKLTYLNLDGNRLSGLPRSLTSSLPSLEELSLNYNKIAILHRAEISRLRSLKTLRLKGNIISFIDDATFKGMDALTELHLDGNRLSHITAKTFEGLDNLQLLTVSHNRIETWPSDYGKMFINLHTLHLGSNFLRRFTQEHVVNMSKLQNLSLDNNSISEISEELLAPLKRLRYLDMSRNYLEETPKLAFKASCYLSVLIINDNKIRTPHSEWFQHFAANKDDLEQLVNLTGNPWHCDCSVIEYQSFLDDLRLDRDTTSLMEMLEITCSSPKYAADSILDDDLMDEIKYRTKCPPPTTEPAPTTPCVDSKCNYTTPFTPVLFVPSEINHPDTEQFEMPNFGLNAMTSTASLSKEIPESGGNPATPILVCIPIVAVLCVVFFLYYMWKKRGNKTRLSSTSSRRGLFSSLSSSKGSGADLKKDTFGEVVVFAAQDANDVRRYRQQSGKSYRSRTPSERPLLCSESSDLEMNPTVNTITLQPVIEDNVFEEEPEEEETDRRGPRFGNRADGDGRSVGGTPNMGRDTTMQATNVV